MYEHKNISVKGCALEDAANMFNLEHQLKLINNEEIFVSVCNLYNKIMQRKMIYGSANDIIADDYYSAFMFEATLSLLKESKFTLHELNESLQYVQPKISKKIEASKIVPALIKWLRYPQFEPEWHMKKRGDTRKLLNIPGKNLWRHLLDLYTDPEYSRMRPPDYVNKAGVMYKNYLEFCKKATEEGHAELRRLYGSNVDLTPLTDKRKVDDEYDISSMFTLISSGEMEKVLKRS